MEEEFQESEVIFLDHHYHHHDQRTHNYREKVVASHANSQFIHSSNSSINNSNSSQKSKRKKKKKKKSSAPVSIPESIFQFPDSDDFEEDDYDDDDNGNGEFVPPHVILGRRIAGKMAFSVCTGNGRTLKGRDLSQVRNSILKLTGFLET